MCGYRTGTKPGRVNKLAHLDKDCRMITFIALGSVPLSAQESEHVKMHLEKLSNTVEIVAEPSYAYLCEGFEAPVHYSEVLGCPSNCQARELQAKLRLLALHFPGPSCFVGGVRSLNLLAECLRCRGLIIPGIWSIQGNRVLREVLFESRPPEIGPIYLNQ